MATDAERSFRRALGAYATGVAVISAARAGGVSGITINSLASVSLTPPLILWCLGDQSERYDIFAEAEFWGVTVLGVEDEALARRLAKPECETLQDTESEDFSGAPVLTTGIAHLSCRTFDRRVAGDHLVIIGEVLAFRTADEPALTFFRGQYGATSEEI